MSDKPDEEPWPPRWFQVAVVVATGWLVFELVQAAAKGRLLTPAGLSLAGLTLASLASLVGGTLRRRAFPSGHPLAAVGAHVARAAFILWGGAGVVASFVLIAHPGDPGTAFLGLAVLPFASFAVLLGVLPSRFTPARDEASQRWRRNPAWIEASRRRSQEVIWGFVTASLIAGVVVGVAAGAFDAWVLVLPVLTAAMVVYHLVVDWRRGSVADIERRARSRQNRGKRRRAQKAV